MPAPRSRGRPGARDVRADRRRAARRPRRPAVHVAAAHAEQVRLGRDQAVDRRARGSFPLTDAAQRHVPTRFFDRAPPTQFGLRFLLFLLLLLVFLFVVVVVACRPHRRRRPRPRALAALAPAARVVAVHREAGELAADAADLEHRRGRAAVLDDRHLAFLDRRPVAEARLPAHGDRDSRAQVETSTGARGASGGSSRVRTMGVLSAVSRRAPAVNVVRAHAEERYAVPGRSPVTGTLTRSACSISSLTVSNWSSYAGPRSILRWSSQRYARVVSGVNSTTSRRAASLRTRIDSSPTCGPPPPRTRPADLRCARARGRCTPRTARARRR